MFGGQVAQPGLLNGGLAGTRPGSRGAVVGEHDVSSSAEITTQLADLSRTLREHQEAQHKQLTTTLLEMKAAVISSADTFASTPQAAEQQLQAGIQAMEQQVAATAAQTAECCSAVFEGAQASRVSARVSQAASSTLAADAAAPSAAASAAASSQAAAAASKLVSSGI